MPGLSQLKKFNEDIRTIGHEAELLASRGETYEPLPIPKTVQDVDDSADFKNGMPITEPETTSQPEDDVSLEDIQNSLSPDSVQATQTKEAEAPPPPNIDLSSLLSPTIAQDDENAGEEMPDLSMFADEPIEEEEPEEEPEPDVADLSLDDLLNAPGFDEPEETEETAEESVDEVSSEVPQSTSSKGPSATPLSQEPLPVSPLNETEEIPVDDFTPPTTQPTPQPPESVATEPESVAEVAEDAESLEPVEELEELEELSDNEGLSGGTSFSAEDFANEIANFKEQEATTESASSSDAEPVVESAPSAAPADDDFGLPVEDFVPETGTLSEPVETPSDETVSSDTQTPSSGIENFDLDALDDISSLDEKPASDVEPVEESAPSAAPVDDDFGLPVEDFVPETTAETPASVEPVETPSDAAVSSDTQAPSGGGGIENFDLDALDDISSLDEKPASDAEPVEESAPSATPVDDDFGLPVEDFVPETTASEVVSSNAQPPSDEPISSEAQPSADDDFGLPVEDFVPETTATDEQAPSGGGGIEDFDLDALDDMPSLDETPASDAEPAGESAPSAADDDYNLPDMDLKSLADDGKDDDLKGFDFNLDEGASDDGGETGGADENVPFEEIDTSAMEGMEFPDTDSQLTATKDGFELADADNIGTEFGDFEIPGYSDVDTVVEQKKLKDSKPLPKSKKEEIVDEDLPPNTLSDKQYEKFLKNLAAYPLNVKVALEEFIIKNEFTDEAEFEIIQKVLKKVPARQLASELEKILDVPISVPRDFERRTSEEYEAYKSSLQYQLRNKIIPWSLAAMLAAGMCVLLFLFTKNFIYKPLKASGLYKEGYELLLNSDYPQSEEKFVEATKFDMQKKWFFKYAQGYRQQKQYIRAENMYEWTLDCFNHDKKAGLEYAEMELNDLANYEKTEEILKRKVLDYHVNDADALLLLGDNYLEWATEKDEEKFEDARARYSELVQLYGPNDKNMSRMMRYFIRTDNLLEVLQLKGRFMPKEKSLGGQDWTELSGFLLDKLYGPLHPNDEYLRNKIEDVKETLLRAVRAESANPIALYNLSRYYIHMKNGENAKSSLNHTLDAFGNAATLKKRDLYKYIDTYRLLGEQFIDEKEYLKARESLTAGISLFTNENDKNGFEGTEKIGKLYADIGDIDYFIAGDMNAALLNYQDSIANENDTTEIRYKIGAIQYGKQNYLEALGSFMKVAEDNFDDQSLLLAMGNTLSLRNDDYASKGYYERLIDSVNYERSQKGVLFPQVNSTDAEFVDFYLKATNNLGVTLYRLASRTGNSNLNAQAMVNLQESMRAWDAMTRNQQTLVRLGGSNLAEQNIKYIAKPISTFEPAIYTDIPKTLSGEKGLE